MHLHCSSRSSIQQCSIFRYYGCGPVFPEAVEGCHVLDLGSGSGRDCFVLSKLVGEKGYVTGVDMTKEQVQLSVFTVHALLCQQN